MPTSSPLHVRLGLLEPQLAANQVSEHPPVPGSRETRPGRSLPLRWTRPVAGGGHPRVAIPQCTVPQRERAPWGVKGAGPSVQRRTAGSNCSQKDTGQAALGAPISLHFCLSGRASSLIPSFFSPVSLLLSTPTLLNHFISITKEK